MVQYKATTKMKTHSFVHALCSVPPSVLAAALHAHTEYRNTLTRPPPASVFRLYFPSDARFLLDVSILLKGTNPRWHLILKQKKDK